MDKKTLNNEIVLCRAVVRKAKVAVIRKVLKKMKILKSCKIESVKEKKLRKSERLFQKVQIMKKIKVDEVTKFALRNHDLEPFLQGPKVELKKNVMAYLAKHKAVAKKINSIREQIPNWEVELSPLLDSLGKNRKKFKSKKDPINLVKDKDKEKPVKKSKVSKVKMVKNVPKEETTKPGRLTQAKFDATNDSDKSDESDSNITENSPNLIRKADKVKKIDDPFFIGKKVIAPKLVSQSLSNRKNYEKVSKLKELKLERETKYFMLDKKESKDFSDLPSQVPKKVASPQKEEVLHPSWAAKKVKLIKPFQGKKIKFSDD